MKKKIVLIGTYIIFVMKKIRLLIIHKLFGLGPSIYIYYVSKSSWSRKWQVLLTFSTVLMLNSGLLCRSEKSKICWRMYVWSFFFFIAKYSGSGACSLLIDRTFGSAELFGRTFTVRFSPNDRTFFCRTQNFFSYYI